MAMADYCRCEVCGGKAFYDAHMNFDDLLIDGSWTQVPAMAGDYAGLCIDCAKTHRLTAVKRDKPVTIIVQD